MSEITLEQNAVPRVANDASLPETDLSGKKKLVSWIIGFLLIAAAVLKSSHIFSGASNISFQMQWLDLAIANLEFAIGFGLLLRPMLPLPWIAASAFFFIGFCVNGWAFLNNETTCGRLGAIAASPKWMSLIDGLCLIAVIQFGIPWSSLRASRLIERLGRDLLLAQISFIAVLLGCYLPHNSMVRVFLAKLDGDELLVLQPHQRIVVDTRGDIVKTQAEIMSLSKKEVHIVGMQTDCSMIQADNVPLVVPAGGRASVEIVIDTHNIPIGKGDKEVHFFSDARTTGLKMTIHFDTSHAKDRF